MAKQAKDKTTKQDRDGLSRRPNSRFYWMCYVDEDGETVRKSTKETDRKQAVQVRAEAIRRVSLIRQGLLDPAAEKRKAKRAEPIRPKVEAYLRALAADGVKPKCVAERRWHLTTIVAGLGWSTLRDIEPKSLAAFLIDLRERPSSHAGYRLSDRTLRGYGNSMRNFVRWLVEEGCLQKNLLDGLKLPSARTRHRRRMLLPEEYLPLAEATLAGPSRCRLTGADRLLLYRTAIMTGFRASELAALTIGSLQRHGDGFVLFLGGEHTKNGKDARIDVPTDLAHDLRDSFKAARPSRQSLLRMPRRLQALAEMLRADLAAAREAWLEASSDAAERAERTTSYFLLSINAAGEKLVMHGLRHTSGAWQVLAGVPLNVVKERMRHSKITLTLDTYGHLAPGQERAACDTLAAAVPSVQKMCSKERRNGPSGAEIGTRNAGANEGESGENGLESRDFPLVQEPEFRSPRRPAEPLGRRLLPLKNALETAGSSGAVLEVCSTAPADPHLDRLAWLWPDLPEAVRSALLATAEAAVATRPAMTTRN